MTMTTPAALLRVPRACAPARHRPRLPATTCPALRRLTTASAVAGLLLLVVLVAPTPSTAASAEGGPSSQLQPLDTVAAHGQLGTGRVGRDLKQLPASSTPACCEVSGPTYSNGRTPCVPLTGYVTRGYEAAACLGQAFIDALNAAFTSLNQPAPIAVFKPLPSSVPGNPNTDNPSCQRCLACCPVGSVCGDPHVTGFDGSGYLLYGKPNATYSLISECDHQVNIRLYQPPSLKDGHALFIQAVGVTAHATRISVELVPAAAKEAAAQIVVAINGGEQFGYPGHPMERAIEDQTSFAFESASRVTITTRGLTLSVRLLDGDHLDVGVDEVATNWRDVHGIMGQTYAAAFKIKYNYAKAQAVGVHPGTHARIKASLNLKGSEDDYIVSSLFGTDDKFNRFCRKGQPASQHQSEAVAVSRKLRADSSGVVARVKSVAGISMMDNAGLSKVAPGRQLLQDIDFTPYYSCF